MIQSLFYRFLNHTVRWVGRKPAAFFTWFVVTGHFLFTPRRVNCGLIFYQRLFPHFRFWQRLALVWRQYHQFSQIFIDRLTTHTLHPPQFTSHGWQYLDDALRSGDGAVLVMSHIGNWEMAAAFLKQRAPNIRLMLMMGQRATEQIEGRQKQAMTAQGIRIAVESADQTSPLAMIPAIRWLQTGGVVAMTGDKCWQPSQRTVTIPFLGQPASFPAAPWALALLAHTPALVFFANRQSNGSYHFNFHQPIMVNAENRNHRDTAIAAAAGQYVSWLENQARRYPEQWFHFESIWEQGTGSVKWEKT